MADDDHIAWRLERVEGEIAELKSRVTATFENGRFVRRDTYESDQRAQEKTDMAQMERIAEMREDLTADVERIEAAAQWLQRQLIVMLLGILSVAAVAALAMRAAQ